MCDWSQVWNWWEARGVARMICHSGGGVHLHIRCWVRLVLGSTWLACARWDFAIGNSLCRSECHCLGENDLYIYRGTILLNHFCHLKFGLFIFFAFFVILLTIFIYYFVPETKGIPSGEMGQIWTNQRYWKRFIDTRSISIRNPVQ